MKVAVLGLGYVGSVSATGLAAAGHTVVGVDVDPDKVRTLTAGRSPVVEPGIEQMLTDALSAGHLRATTSMVEALDGADVSLICVGTPSGHHGHTDLGAIDRVVDDMVAAMSRARPPAGGRHVVAVRSTVPPGTLTGRVAAALSRAPSQWQLGTAMCPEFLREGTAVSDFFDPPVVVVGTCDADTARTMRDLFAFIDSDVRVVPVETAEALKYACNAFHATKVSFANELARIFRNYGVDTRQVMELFCTDTKLNISTAYLRPGFAYGGSCLPKEVRALQALARDAGVDAPLMSGTTQSNDAVVRELIERVIETGAHRVAMLGLSFKADTDDLRESPYVEVAERLIGKGYELTIFDPIVNPDRLLGANLVSISARLPHLRKLLTCRPEDALAGADVAIVSTRHEQALTALLRRPPAHVFDLNGRLAAAVEELPGYVGVGW